LSPSHLHDQVWPEGAYTGNANSGFGGTVGSTRTYRMGRIFVSLYVEIKGMLAVVCDAGGVQGAFVW